MTSQTTPKRHVTTSGRFEVSRGRSKMARVISIRHVESGLAAGSFSHLAVRSFKHALAGLEAVEASLTPEQLAGLDGPSDLVRDPAALHAFVAALRAQFPNGAWSR